MGLSELGTFYFDSTLCEPGDPGFAAWLGSISAHSPATTCGMGR